MAGWRLRIPNTVDRIGSEQNNRTDCGSVNTTPIVMSERSLLRCITLTNSKLSKHLIEYIIFKVAFVVYERKWLEISSAADMWPTPDILKKGRLSTSAEVASN